MFCQGHFGKMQSFVVWFRTAWIPLECNYEPLLPSVSPLHNHLQYSTFFSMTDYFANCWFNDKRSCRFLCSPFSMNPCDCDMLQPLNIHKKIYCWGLSITKILRIQYGLKYWNRNTLVISMVVSSVSKLKRRSQKELFKTIHCAPW